MNYRNIAALISLVLLAYLIARAALVPLYGDEVSTFFFYLQAGGFQPYYSQLDANNHVLNSALAHLSFLAFGDGPLALRAPNVLAFVIYIFFIFRFQRIFQNNWLWFVWFLSMTMCHYVFEFFQLCRGYGLSYGFLLGALFYLLMFRKNTELKFCLSGLVMLSLALWSNLATMVFVFVTGVMFGIIFIANFHFERAFRKALAFVAIYIIAFLAPLVYAVKYTLHLQESGRLYLGYANGFWRDSVLSLVKEFSDKHNWGLYFLCVLLGLYVVALVLRLAKRGLLIDSFPLHLSVWLTVFGTIFLHHWKGVNYPVDRAAAHYIPLFLISFYLLFDGMPRHWTKALSVIAAVVLGVHFLAVANLTHTTHWKNEAVAEDIYVHMLDWKTKNGRPPIISCDHFHNTVLAYYDLQHQGMLYGQELPNHPNINADFILALDGIQPAKDGLYDTIAYQEYNGLALLQRKTNQQWIQAASFKINDGLYHETFVSFGDISVSEYKLKEQFAIEVSLLAKSSHFPMKWWFTVQVMSSNGEFLSVYSTNLQHGNSDLRNEQPIRFRQLIENLPVNASAVRLLIWNIEGKPLHISNAEVTFLQASNIHPR